MELKILGVVIKETNLGNSNVLINYMSALYYETSEKNVVPCILKWME